MGAGRGMGGVDGLGQEAGWTPSDGYGRRAERGRRALPKACAPVPRPPRRQYVEREIVNHSNFVHPHVVQFKEAGPGVLGGGWGGGGGGG